MGFNSGFKGLKNAFCLMGIGIAYRDSYRLDGCSSKPGESNRFSVLHTSPDRPWGPHNFL